MTSVTLQGNTYSDDGTEIKDMLNGGHRTHFFPLVQDYVTTAADVEADATQVAADKISAENAAGSTKGTSTTSVVVGSGSKALTTQASKQFEIGNYLTIVRTSDVTVKMFGDVTAYNSGTGSLTVNVILFENSGTFTDWTIALSGPDGVQGATGDGSVTYQTKSATYTLTAADKASFFELTGTWTLSLQAAATLGSTWATKIKNVGTGTITLDPSGAETINGNATKAIYPGAYYELMCDGTSLRTSVEPLISAAVFSDGTALLNGIGTSSTAFNSTHDLASTSYDAVCSDGTTFVTSSGGAPTIASVYSSTDGSTWTARSMPTTQGWAVASDGAGFLAIDVNGLTTAYSASGTSWASKTNTPATTYTLSGLAAVSGIYLIRDQSTSTTVYKTVDDGTNWTTETLPAGSVFVSSYGSVFVIYNLNNSTYYTSTTGATSSWTSRTMPGSSTYMQSTPFGFFAYKTGTSNSIYHSTDGVNWTEYPVGAVVNTPIGLLNGMIFYKETTTSNLLTQHVNGEFVRANDTAGAYAGKSWATVGDIIINSDNGILGLIDGTAVDAVNSTFVSEE